MRFTISAAAFEQLVSTVIGVCQKKTTTPVLGHLLIQVAGTTILMTGTNGEIEAGSRAKLASLEEEGAICVEGSKLSALLRSFEGDKLVSFHLEDEKAVLKCGRSRFKLATLPSSSFPNIDCENEEWAVRSIEVEGEAFLKQVARVNPAMAANDARHFLNGMLVEIRPGQISLVATDGHRLAKGEMDADVVSNASCIVPRKMVNEILRSFGKTPILKLSLSSAHFDIRNNETRLTGRIIEGKYPDYQRVIPDTVAFNTSMDSKRLIGAMKRSLITSQDQTRAVKLNFADRLVIESRNAKDEASKEEMDVQWPHDPLEVAYNGTYLQEALASIKSDSCNIGFQDAKGAMLMTPTDQADRFCVVLMSCRS